MKTSRYSSWQVFCSWGLHCCCWIHITLQRKLAHFSDSVLKQFLQINFIHIILFINSSTHSLHTHTHTHMVSYFLIVSTHKLSTPIYLLIFIINLSSTVKKIIHQRIGNSSFGKVLTAYTWRPEFWQPPLYTELGMEVCIYNTRAWEVEISKWLKCFV